MENNQNTIKISGQLYKIHIIKGNDILNIMLTNVITKTSFACALDDKTINEITLNGGFIRNLAQLYDLLIISSKNDENSKIGLIGKIDNNDILILSMSLKLNIEIINDSVMYVIELHKVQKNDIVRMEEMMLDFCEKYAKPSDENQINDLTKLVTDTNDNTKIELAKLITDTNNTKVELAKLITDTNDNIKIELTKLITDTNNNTIVQLTKLITTIQEILTRNNLQ
jgi:hypothetical protein